MQLNPYLNFNGQCEEAFKFYAECLGGTIEMMLLGRDTPMADKMPADCRDKVMHVRMVVGDLMLMGSDVPANEYEKPQGFSVSLIVDKVAEAERIFNALAAGGAVKMPLQKTFWADAFGMLVDRFGTPWLVNCEEAA